MIEKLAKDYARFFEIKPYLWETEPMLASGSFQDAIVPPGETDILVLILWARLGTPLPERTSSREYRGIDGRAPVTGTEWEFEAALSAHKERGAPDLLAYRKAAAPLAEFRSDADLEELRSQLQKLNSFWQRHFVDQGEFRAAFGEFADLDGFEGRLEADLRALIERRIAALKGEPERSGAKEWLQGSPFRGLETYRFEHAPIFFGRTQATRNAVEHLLRNAGANKPFLLVLGASGAGKSSLAQAGIVPALAIRGVVPGVGVWRRAVLRPGGHPGGPFMALATALSDNDALPELLRGQDIADLARHLESAADNPGFPIVSALAVREDSARRDGELMSFEGIRLILVVDQFEELFTLGEVTPERRRAFVTCLKGLMDSGRIFVVATMRSDYWHRAAELPTLVALAEGEGRLDLLPPTQAEITEMIRRPAEVARLSFETEPRSEIRLDAALADEASREPGALPLLSFLLDALYRKDVEEDKGSTLRFASMAGIGGLKGAIAARAEATFAALPPEAQAALPKVLRSLVTVSRTGAEPTARAVALERFAEGGAERRVVEAFLSPDVRLLVAEGDGDGARIRVAHEALITHWDRARRQIAQDRDDLRTRAMVEQAEAEWQTAQGSDKRGYLLRDPQLANATDLAKRWGEEFDPRTLGFIHASRQRARLLQRLTMAAAAVFALLAIGASVLGFLAVNSRQQAEAQRNQALTTQSLFLADLARQQLANHDASAALLLAIDALPDKDATTIRPYAPEAELQLDAAWRALRERAILVGHRDGVNDAAFSPDGSRIATASSDKTVQLWDAQTGKPVGEPFTGHEQGVQGVAFSPDGSRIVTASVDRTARLWDAKSGKPVGTPLTGHGDTVFTARFSPDGKLIATASGDKTARIWNAQTGEQVRILAGHTDMVMSAIFSADGEFILTASQDSTARLWSARTGEEIRTFTAHSGAMWNAAFSPDGKYIVAACGDNAARVWDAESGDLIGALTGHTDAVRSATFSPDGKRLLTASFDKTIRLWDADNGKPIGAPLGGHDDWIWMAAFSPDGRRIVTASYDKTARLWDADAGPPAMRLNGDEDRLLDVAFSPDGSQIATASDDATVQLWDATTRQPIGKPFAGHEDWVYSVAYSFDGKRIVTASKDKTARQWDVQTGMPIGEPLKGHDGAVWSAAYSPDGRRIVTASDDTTARLWDAETGKPVGAPLAGHSAGVSGVAFSPDGKRVATASADKTARVWSVETGKQIGVSLAGHSATVSSIAFSPDGKLVATASFDKTVRLWSADTGKPLGAPMVGHDDRIFKAVFSADGKRILTASDDNTARLWDVGTGKQIAIFPANIVSSTRAALTSHKGMVHSAAFSPDGKRVVMAAETELEFRDIFANTEEFLAHARASAPRCLTREQRIAAFLEPMPPAWCIDMEKWPYQSRDWKDWLTYKRANADPPLPDSSEWTAWMAARKK